MFSPFSPVDPIGRKFDRDVVGAELKHYRYDLREFGHCVGVVCGVTSLKSRAAESSRCRRELGAFQAKISLAICGVETLGGKRV